MINKFWFQAHWLIGITAGLVLALVGATGALLSFEDETLRLLNPSVLTVQAPQQKSLLTVPELLQRIQQTEPQRRVTMLTVSSDPERPARAVFAARDGGRRGESRYFDPYTAALLGGEDQLRGHDFLHVVEDLHRRLAAGDTGKAVTGACTFALLVMVLSGLYLRWPQGRWTLRQWFVVNRRLSRRPFLRSLHSVVGTWVLPIYLISALTGLYWSYDWYRDGVYALAGVTPPVRQPPRGPEAGRKQRPMSAEAVTAPDLRIAWARFDEAVPAYVNATLRLPEKPGQALQINYLEAAAPHDRASSRIDLDPGSGDVKKHEPYADKTVGAKLIASMFVLHSGEFFGLTGRILTLLAAASMPVFAVTGLMMYFSRRRLKKKVKQAAVATALADMEPSAK